MNSVHRDLFRDAATLGGAHVLSRTFITLWIILVARLLGVADFGRFSILFSALLTAQAVADTGLSPLVTRGISRHGLTSQYRLIASSFVLQGSIGIVAAAVTIVIAIVAMDSSIAAASAVGMGVAAVSLGPIAKGVLRATQRFDIEGRLQALSALALLLGTAAFLFLRPTVTGMLFFYALIQTLSTAILIVVALPKDLRFPGRLTKHELVHIFKAGLPFNILSTASLLYLRADMFALDWVRSDLELGHYSAAVQVYHGAWIFGSVLAIVSLPRLVRNNNSVQSQASLHSAGLLMLGMFLVGALLGLIMLITATRFLPLLFGPDFTSAAPLLRVLACSMPLVYLNFALGQILIAANRERVIMLNALLLATIALAAFPFAAVNSGGNGVAFVVVGLTAVSTAIQGRAVLAARALNA